MADDKARVRLAARLDRRTRLAQLGLALERFATAIWPLATTALLFVAITAFGLWGLAPDWARLGLLAAFALAALYGLVALWRGFSWPSRGLARARLDEGQPDRPVASFDEAQALGREDAGASALWAAHQRRVAVRAARATAPRPRLVVGGRRDPFGLRIFATLAAAAALLLGPREATLSEAFAPLVGPAAAGPEPTIELWVTPPAYTGAPPLYFASGDDRRGERRTPAGAVVSVKVFDARRTPRLTLEPAPAEPAALAAETDEAGAETGAYAAELTLTRDTRLTLALGAGAPEVDLRFTVTPDLPPTIALIDPPDRGAGGALTFSFAAGDDYGVEKAIARIALDAQAVARGEQPIAPDAQPPLEFELPAPLARDLDALAGLPAEEAEALRRAAAETVEERLAGHPWVGLPVTMTLIATDAAGQSAETEPVAFVLPGPLFSEPMAKAILEQRAALAWADARAPRANRTLEAVSRRPQDYFEDTGAYLLLRSALSRLGYALAEGRVAAEKPSVMETLYAAAERLENAGVENAAEKLARAQRRLREAIRNGASEEEIHELMAELREAVDEYMQALRDLAERNPEMAQEFMRQQGQAMSGDQLEQMLNALEEAARGGAKEEAEQLLSMLEQLMNSLRPGGPAQAGAGEGSDQQGSGDPTLDQLQDLLGEQQRLAERSFEEFQRRQREGQPGQGQPGQGQPGPGQTGQGEQGQGEQGQGQGEPGQGEQGQQGERSGPNGSGRAPTLGELRQRQEALREALRQFREGLDAQHGAENGGGANPNGEGAPGGRDGMTDEEMQALGRDADEAFDRADEAMREAERALGETDPGVASEEQMRAVDELRDGAGRIAEALRERQRRQAQAEGARQPGRENGEGAGSGRDSASDRAQRTPRDPFGRDSGTSGLDGGPIGVPDSFRAPLARDLLEELRRRAGELERPQLELEYFERLLERFR